MLVDGRQTRLSLSAPLTIRVGAVETLPPTPPLRIQRHQLSTWTPSTPSIPFITTSKRIRYHTPIYTLVASPVVRHIEYCNIPAVLAVSDSTAAESGELLSGLLLHPPASIDGDSTDSQPASRSASAVLHPIEGRLSLELLHCPTIVLHSVYPIASRTLPGRSLTLTTTLSHPPRVTAYVMPLDTSQ